MIVNYKMIFLRGGGVFFIIGVLDIYIFFKLLIFFKCIKKICIDYGLGIIIFVMRCKLRESSLLLFWG